MFEVFIFEVFVFEVFVFEDFGFRFRGLRFGYCPYVLSLFVVTRGYSRLLVQSSRVASLILSNSYEIHEV